MDLFLIPCTKGKTQTSLNAPITFYDSVKDVHLVNPFRNVKVF